MLQANALDTGTGRRKKGSPISKAGLLVLGCVIGLTIGCTSGAKKEPVTLPPPPPEDAGPAQESIDVSGLQRSLGLERPNEELGLEEKTFQTCQAGYGYSSSQNCRQLVMSVAHFRLQCRDSVGTVAEGLTASDLTPLAGRDVAWSVKGENGIVTSDGEGFAQIRVLSPASLKNQRIRLTVGTQFLYIRAGELTRVVTPRPWCEQ